MVKARIYNHGMAVKTIDYGPILERFVERFGKCVIFASPTLITRLRRTAEQAAIRVHRFDDRTPADVRQVELDRFVAAPDGVILTTPRVQLGGELVQTRFCLCDATSVFDQHNLTRCCLGPTHKRFT